MGALNTEQSNVEAVTALTNAPTIRKLLRMPDEWDGKTNFEILKVQAIKELANGHNCEVTIRVDLAFGHEGLPVPENERYSVRTETVRRIDLKDVAEFAELELNDKQQYIGAGSTVEAVATLLGAALTEDDITVSPIKDVFWVRAKDNSVGYTGQLTIAADEEVPVIKVPTEEVPIIKVPTSITATLSATEVNVGSAVTYTADLLPADAVDKTYTVVADKPALVTIDTVAKTVTGKGVGIVKLTFQSVTAPSVKVVKTLNVKSLPAVKPTGITVTGLTGTLAVGSSQTYAVSVTPGNAADKTFTVENLTPEFITVDTATNKVTAIAKGAGQIRFVAIGDPSVTNVANVTVTAVTPTSILIYSDKVDFAVGEQINASVDVLPAEAEDKSYTTVSSNPAILSVDVNGNVSAAGVGVASIKHTSKADPSVESNDFSITVHPAVKSLVFTSPSTVPHNGGEINVALTVDRTPSNATFSKVVYSVVAVSDGVAEIVSGTNQLTAVGLVEGSTIKVKALIRTYGVGSIDDVSVEQTITISGEM